MDVNCFKCNSADHLFANCPERAPRRKAAPAAAPQPAAGAALPSAKDYDAHLAVIEGYVSSWQRGEITTGEKRRAISDENLSYYGDKCRPELLWQGGPGDDTRVGTLPDAAAAIFQAEADAAAQAAAVRKLMGWSAEQVETQRREKALAQVAESRAARGCL